MGIDVFAFNFLLKLKGQDLGDALCLGRQGLHIRQGYPEWEQAQRSLSASDPGRGLASLADPSGYAERFLHYLGARSVLAMDMSPYEGAAILHDLNMPVPSRLHAAFDFILDGGTLEHVFNIPAAVANIKAMLRPGGLFVAMNPANNCLGHGLYQFSPELFWQLYSEQAGFCIERMQLVPLTDDAPTDLVETPGLRQERDPTPHAAYIMVAARRSPARPIATGDVYQSDYTAAWERHRTMPG